MSKIWFTSDLHFGHIKEFLWGPRGFQSMEEHRETVFNNFNSVVAANDEVYILGDSMLGDNSESIEYIKRLNGHIHIILGNHDTSERAKLYEQCDNVVEVVYATVIKYKKYQFYLSHYETMMGNYDMQMSKMWNLHGHTHSKNKFGKYDKCYNVALDAHNNFPIEIEEVLSDIQQKWNEIYKEKQKEARNNETTY